MLLALVAFGLLPGCDGLDKPLASLDDNPPMVCAADTTATIDTLMLSLNQRHNKMVWAIQFSKIVVNLSMFDNKNNDIFECATSQDYTKIIPPVYLNGVAEGDKIKRVYSVRGWKECIDSIPPPIFDELCSNNNWQAVLGYTGGDPGKTENWYFCDIGKCWAFYGYPSYYYKYVQKSIRLDKFIESFRINPTNDDNAVN